MLQTPDPDEQAAVVVKRDAMLAELRALKVIIDQGEAGKTRRREVWAALSEMSVQQKCYPEELRVRIARIQMAEASGTSETAITLSIQRHEKRKRNG